METHSGNRSETTGGVNRGLYSQDAETGEFEASLGSVEDPPPHTHTHKLQINKIQQTKQTGTNNK